MKRVIILMVVLSCVLLSVCGCKKTNTENDHGHASGDEKKTAAPISEKMKNAGSSGQAGERDNDMYPHASKIVDTIMEFGGFITTNSSEDGSRRTFEIMTDKEFNESVLKLKSLGFTKTSKDGEASSLRKDKADKYFCAADEDGVICELAVIDEETVLSVCNTADYLKN